MPLPKSSSLMELGCGVGCMGTVFVGGTVLALFHLWDFREASWTTLAAAIIWLLFLGANIAAHRSVSRFEGTRLRDRVYWALGCFARSHFVETETSGDETIVRIGFRVAGRSWYTLTVPGQAIVSVEWSAGQATGLTGRDCSDWHVWLWYRDPARPRPLPGFTTRAETLRQIGREGPREKMAALGVKLIDFLRQAGVDLKPTADPTKFTVTGELPVWISPESPS